ncbi:MAG: MBL fold metallo-hydrolase [Gammaproteobacteria bacterium]
MSGRLDYLEPAPGFGESRTLAPGVEWLRLPLPFPPGHINVYRLEGDEGEPFLVDTGFAEEQTTVLWRDACRRPRRAVVTHFHPDHIGQAAGLAAGGTEVHISGPEWDKARALHELSGDRIDASIARFFADNGMQGAYAPARRGNGYRRSVPELPSSISVMEPGPLPFARGWNASFASGHSPAHALLFRADNPVLAAGDVVLPRITPNISVWPDAPDADPLGDYLAALERLRALPGDTLVLPAHGLAFRGLHERLDGLAEHHAARLDELHDLLHRHGSCTARTALPELFSRELKPSSVPFALGETLAHLNRLWLAGEAAREVDASGVWYYTR